MKKQPEQTAHTRQAMIDAFWELAKKQGTDKVTISAITKKANLNRGTFYVYFTDIQDLLAHAEEDMIHDFQGRMKAAVAEGGIINYEIASKKLVEAFTLYDDKFFLALGKNGNPNFIARIREESAVMFRELFDIDGKNPYREYIIAYATSAFTGLLTYWHDLGRKISTEELAGIMYSIVTRGVFGVASEAN